MDNNTTQLIEQLANKLGTTSQYLWGILVKQAPIEATITLVQFIVLSIALIILYKLHKRFSVKSGEYKRSMYYEYDSLAPAMICAVVIFGILFILCFCCTGEIINGYFNPEYWALHHILSEIK